MMSVLMGPAHQMLFCSVIWDMMPMMLLAMDWKSMWMVDM